MQDKDHGPRVVKEPTIEHWRHWLNKELGGWFSALVNDNLIAREFFEMMESAPHPNAHEPFVRWIYRSYETHAIISIRRLIDDDSRTISFFRLLNHLQNHHKKLTVDALLKQIGDPLRTSEHDYLLQNWVCATQPKFVSYKRIARDIARLETIRKRIKLFDQRSIHLQNKPTIPAQMTWSQIARCVRILDTLYCRYYRLLMGGSLLTAAADYPTNWKLMFSKPWIAPSYPAGI
jgi:hypothetical protein